MILDLPTTTLADLALAGAGAGRQARAGDGDAARPSWYFAKFATPGTESAGQGRRAARYRLRDLLRDVTTVRRVRGCGAHLLAPAAEIVAGLDGVAHFSGIETCGRIWLCPVCAAKIRNARGEEISRAFERWVKEGHGALFVTVTLPHDQGDALAASLDALTAAWRLVCSGKAWTTDRRRYGLQGAVKAVEVTHGANGWHPHAHLLFAIDAPLTERAVVEWRLRLQERWDAALVAVGWRPSLSGIGIRVDVVWRDVDAVARYVMKVQESSLSNELARGDLKRARAGSRTPFDILADFGTDGLVDDLDLWHEFERATRGKSALRWGRGLRALLLPDEDEQTDEEIAAAEVGGEKVAYVLPRTWYRLGAMPGGTVGLLEAYERGGFPAAMDYVLALGLDASGILLPDEYTAFLSRTVTEIDEFA